MQYICIFAIHLNFRMARENGPLNSFWNIKIGQKIIFGKSWQSAEMKWKVTVFDVVCRNLVDFKDFDLKFPTPSSGFAS